MRPLRDLAVVAALAVGLVASAVASATGTATAQRQPGGPSVVSVDTSGAPLVEVVLAPGPGAEVPTYVVDVEGTERPASARQVQAADVVLGIVVDNPPSLPADDLRAIRAAALELVLAAPPGTPVAVAGTAGPAPTLTNDAAAAVAAVAELAGPERPAADPLSATRATVDALAGGGGAAPALVLIASSRSAAGDDAASAVAEELDGDPAVVSVLSLDGAPPPWLAQVEASPAGRAVTADRDGLLRESRSLGSALSAMHVVTFEATDTDGGALTVAADAGAGGDAPVRLVVTDPSDGSQGSGLGVVALLSGVSVVVALGALAVRRRGWFAQVAGPAGEDGTPPVVPRSRTVPTPPSVAPAAENPVEEPVPAALFDPDPAVRRRAAQLSGHGHSSTAVVARLVALLDDVDPVAEMAAYSLGERGDPRPDVVEGLSRMARHHPESRCREAAVAALGAIAAGLPTILAASADDCPAVRRRAVYSLAPFDGPNVDRALQRAAEDGDIEVRRAAEGLTGR